MLRIFDLVLNLYPPAWRVEFGAEMRSVFQQLLQSRGRRSLPAEYSALICGAAREWCRHGWELAQTIACLAAGLLSAAWAHLLLYRYLVSHLAIACLFAVGIASAQEPHQDPAALENARSLYRSAFAALRDARTMEDMRKLAADFSASDFASIDRFGRTVPQAALDADLAEMLSLPAERRAARMEILWAEQDSSRLIVLAWMMPNVVDGKDAAGVSHRLTRATLVRDIFTRTEDGWRRSRHDKLTPNDIVLAVDGAPRIVPPLDEQNRVTPAK